MVWSTIDNISLEYSQMSLTESNERFGFHECEDTGYLTSPHQIQMLLIHVRI